MTRVVIPEGVKSIGEGTFESCEGLTSIVIPNSVASIGDRAFFECTGLTRIEIPEGVTSIGRSAFEYCIGLTRVEIPDSVTSIGGRAFYDCRGLTSIVLPGNEELAKLIWNQLPEESRVRCITTFVEKENLKAKLSLSTLLCCAQHGLYGQKRELALMMNALLEPRCGISRTVSRFLTPLKLKDFPALVSEPWKLFQRAGAVARAEASSETGECEAVDDARDGAEAGPR